MLKNILNSSIRSLLKNKATFSLNIFALTIGIAACIVAFLHINYELSFDQYHSNASRIFRVVTGNVATGEGWVKVSAPIAPKIKAEVPEVEMYARLDKFSYNDKVAVKYNQQVYNEDNVFMADPSLFAMFDIEVIGGAIAPNASKRTVWISDMIAEKYAGNQNLIGEEITIDGRMDFQIAGVFKRPTSNSHFDLDFVVPFENLEEAKPGTSLTSNWGQFNYFAYVMLREDADANVAGRKLREILAEYGDNQTLKFEDLRLQALTDIHFQANPGNLKPAYNTRYLQIYTGIAAAILLISFINFINLNIAGSTTRIKEVGVRKVLGASRTQLIAQFVSESTITALISTLLALALVSAVLPFVNNMLMSDLVLNPANPKLILGLALLVLAIALFSGVYISSFIMSFSPVNAVKGAVKIGTKGKRFKETLMTIQFAVSCVLILCSVFIYRQLTYLKNQDIGLDQQGIISLQLYDQKSQENSKVLMNALKEVAGVQSISASDFTPGSSNWSQTVTWNDQDQEVSWDLIMADENFVETFGIELKEGDIENIKALADGQRITYVINEAAMSVANWDQGVGQVISAFGRNGEAPVAGVVNNFNYRSLHNTIEPCILVITKDRQYSQISIKFNSNDVFGMVSNIQSKFEEVMPSTPFEYAFADEQFDQLYKVEQQTSQLVGMLTIISVLLAMMGVYSLLSFTIRERTKEIAIRKVLGIKMKDTMYLLSKDYIKLLIIGNLIGIPCTLYFMQRWLQNFSYQITMGFFTFAGAVIATFVVILIVVGLKVFQIERINPKDALHNE